MYDVICVGSATVDIFAKTQFSELISIRGKKEEEHLLAYPTGSKILIEELDFTTGGGGTNVAVSFARLGMKTACICAVGNDSNATLILEELKREKVDTRFVVKKKGKSGLSLILDSLDHDRTILSYKGVNNAFLPSDLPTSLHTTWFYFSSLLGKSYTVLEALAGYAKKKGIKVAFNPSSYLASQGAGKLKKVLSATTLLALNKEEAADIVGEGSISELAKALHALGPDYVVITDGKNGAYCFHEGKLLFAPTHGIKPLETTGAGDSFASTFLSGLILKKDIHFCLSLATTNAESVITHHGAKNNLLTLSQANSILKKSPVRVKLM